MLRPLARSVVLALVVASCAAPGASPSDVGTKVVGGAEVSAADHPWAVQLMPSEGWRPTAFCGGVVVSTTEVLTAAHCVVGYGPAELVVVPGELAEARRVAVAEIRTHESYVPGDPTWDLALLRLQEELEPERIARLDASEVLPASARVVGWGTTESSARAPSLRAREVVIRDVDEVPEQLRSRWASMVITDGGDGGLCTGDSGGALEDVEDAARIVGILAQVAVSSEDISPCTLGAAVPSARAATWLAWLRAE